MPEPFYITADSLQLYAVYYPAVGAPRNENVLFVPASGQDHVRLYRASHDSAMRLARDGFNVLRFDYRGTGNSSDPDDPLSLDAWQADLTLAAREVIEISGCRKTAALCVRLGSMVLAASKSEFDRLAFLDPVIQGSDFVNELEAVHAAMCANPHKYLNPVRKAEETEDELAGHSMPPALFEDLKQAALADQFKSQDSFAVSSVASCMPELTELFSHAECIPFDCGWRDVSALEEMINPQPCFRHLEGLLSGRGGSS